MIMKQIYQFDVDIDNKPVTVIIKKPNHGQIEDAEFVFSQKFNQLLNAGFLSRSMMNKKYGDIGGAYSDKMIKDLGSAIEKLADCERTIQFFEGAKDLSDDQQEELIEAKDAYANIQFNIANMDRDLEVMYANSADAKSEEHMIKWFVLQTAHFEEAVEKDGKEERETFPLFDGNTFEEKLSAYSEFLDDVEDADTDDLSKKKKIVAASLEKLSRVINLWYHGMGHTSEEVEKNYARYFPELVEEEEEVPEKKPSKKTAKKKVAAKEEVAEESAS
jgi:hypothetical protein